MATAVDELETILKQLIGEHEKLLRQMQSQQAAMKKLDQSAMEDISHLQEATRLRISSLETRRRAVVNQLAKTLRIEGRATLARIAESMPAARAKLLGLRNRLKELVAQVSARATVAGKLAGAVLGHLNTVVRLLAGSVEQAGLYTKNGVPQVSTRIGMLEAVG
jgi:chromosome segregation ATPase